MKISHLEVTSKSRSMSGFKKYEKEECARSPSEGLAESEASKSSEKSRKLRKSGQSVDLPHFESDEKWVQNHIEQFGEEPSFF